MENTADPNIATCPTCGTQLDVADQEPYAKIHCSSCGTWMRVRQHFANYDITGVLGEGGQGMVYRATDKTLKRNVAVKLMKRQYSADPIFVKRFQSEAKTTAGLNHPNIVKVYSFGEDRGLLYLAMELVDHGSLDSLMAEIKKVPEERVLELGIQIAKGLQAGLEKGLIHRDIKPGNILFADEHTAKIVDFGLAVLVEKQHEEEGDVWATPYYVAPEKLDGKPEDFRSDMYSLSATLFHAIAGRPPFIAETNSMSELKKIKSKPVHLLSYAPQASNATAFVIDKALAAKPGDRWPSYAEFIHNLEYARDELRKAPKKSRRPSVAMAGEAAPGGSWLTYFLVAIIVVMGFYIYISRGGRSDGQNPAHAPTAAAPQITPEQAEARYAQARRQLIEGQVRLAAVAFRELYADGRLPEPRHSWSAVHEGLAELLEGRPMPARRAFNEMVQRISPSAIGLDPALVGFFQRLSVAASDEKPSDGAGFAKTNYEAMALLILGLKNWEAGAFEEGIALMRQFQSAAPEGASAWVGEYRTLIGRYLDEYGMFSSVVTEMKRFDSAPDRAEAALKRVPEVKSKIRTSGLLGKLNEVTKDLEPKIAGAVAAAKDAMAKKSAELEAAEEALLTDAKTKLKALCDNYRFHEALATIEAVEVKIDVHVKDRELLLHRIQWLVTFKEQLIRDLNAGYSGPLQRKNGQPILGGVLRATDTQLEIRVGTGSAIITWAEVTPQSVLAMARSFFKPAAGPEALADRQWQAGVFAIFTQLYADSQALMGEAAAVKEEYRVHKALFFGEPDPEPPQPPQPNEPEKPKLDAQPSSGLEMAKDPLNPSKKDLNEAIIKSLRKPVPQ